MSNALQTTNSNAISISEVINASIPVTHDLGDALSYAVQILEAAYSAAIKDNMTQEYRLVLLRAKRSIANQHVEWMKGGN